MQMVRAGFTKLATVPGSPAVREHLAGAFVKPLWSWASPITAPPPPAVVNALRRAILRTGCTWWCKGRWWALKINIHPEYSCLLSAMKRVLDPKLAHSPHLRTSISMVAQRVGLQLKAIDPHLGLCLQLPNGEDKRIMDMTRALRAGSSKCFWTAGPLAEHIVRQICRVRALSTCAKERHDTKGVEKIDIEAQSHILWTRYIRSLDADSANALTIFRSGAMRTQTRSCGYSRVDPRNMICAFCHGTGPSAAHLVTCCPGFTECRRSAARRNDVSGDWWSSLHKITASSGWVTLDAAHTIEKRVKKQIAVCELAIMIFPKLTREVCKKTSVIQG